MVTWTQVQTNLGRTLTPAQQQQAVLWITQTQALIQARLGDLALLDQAILDMVVTEAVTLRLKNPDGVRRRSVAVDDGRVETEVTEASGQLVILDDWWALLTPRSQGGAFSVAPAYEPDTRWDTSGAW